ncbi:MAG: hypothetical protein IT180_04720 [Acidobacteria bacterium]|nr:hypothetical protein [Acidobacteriota bacterium]
MSPPRPRPRPRRPAPPGLPTATTKRRARALTGGSGTRAGTVPVPGTGTVRTPPAATASSPADAAPDLLLDLADTLLPAASWTTWKAVLRDIFGLPLTPAQQATVNALTGRTSPRTVPAREVWVVCGRRAGKSQIAALLAVFLSCFKTYPRAHGERLVGMLLASDRRQARVLKGYIRGLLGAVPRLESLIVRETAEEIELSNGLTIEIHTSSFKSTRGYSSAFVIGDEIAFWPDDGASESAADVLTAVRPGLATTRGLLVCITTPYGRSGITYQTHARHFGKADSPVYVLQAPTLTMNPSLDGEIVKAAYLADPESASAEYGGAFRSDLQSLFDLDALQAVVAEGRRELPPQPGTAYCAFADTSGGSDESFALSIAHKTFEGRAIIDVTREWTAPFNPQKIVAEVAVLLKRYRVTKATGDRYGAQWVVGAFAEHGIAYEHSEQSKSEIFIEFAAMVNAKQVELLDHSRTLVQLAGLQRRTGRSGKDSIDHKAYARDDVANAVAGAALLAVTSSGRAQLPSDFTQCGNPIHLQRCPLAQGRGASPWLPSDPLCTKHCPGARVLLAAYNRYKEVTLQAGQPLTLTHATLLRERFDLESSRFTARCAWAELQNSEYL